MHYNVISYVLFIDFLAIMSPGPDFFMVLKNSLTGSLKFGILTALGIMLGTLITFTLCMLGVGIIVAENHILFTLVKVAGAIYLAYLGISAIFSKAKVDELQLVKHNQKLDTQNLKTYFKIGLLCNLTNPKAMMFMTALSAYVAVHGSPKLDGTVIVAISTFLTGLWFVSVATLFGNLHVREFFYQRQRMINIILGLILLYVAHTIIFM